MGFCNSFYKSIRKCLYCDFVILNIFDSMKMVLMGKALMKLDIFLHVKVNVLLMEKLFESYFYHIRHKSALIFFKSKIDLKISKLQEYFWEFKKALKIYFLIDMFLLNKRTNFEWRAVIHLFVIYELIDKGKIYMSVADVRD